MSKRRGSIGAALLLILSGAVPTLLMVSAAPAAVIRLINGDSPNEGFNDPAAVAPVGGNTGTTLGEQRLIAVQRAVDMWAAALQSPVEIRIGATFDPLPCDMSEVDLGEGGPTLVFRDFAGAPLPNTYYASALADRLAGMDLEPNDNDIETQFNSSFGTICPFPETWYYGLDGAAGESAIDLVTAALHEIGHGMGFISLVDVGTGVRMNDTDDVFSVFLVDDRSGKTFPEMTNAERESAIVGAINPGVCANSSQSCQTDNVCGSGTCQRHTHLKWNGAQVVAASGKLTVGADDMGRVEMYAAPQPIDGSSVSHWNDLLTPDELMEPAYTSALHDIGLAAEALADMGWNLPGAATASPTSTPTPIEAGTPCTGDCNDDGQVTINELITAVDIALGTAPLSLCPAVDVDGNGIVVVNELIGSVGSALDGCDPSATPIPTVTAGPTATPTIAGPTATPTGDATTTPTTGGPTPTPVGSCPVTFQDDSLDQKRACLYIGRWNPNCGDDTLKALFESDGTYFIAAIGNGTTGVSMPFGIAGSVTSARTANLVGWFTDFNMLSDFQTLSGTATLSADGSALEIAQFDSPPFSINACDFVDYQGSFTDTVTSGASQQRDMTRLLPLVRDQLGSR